MKTADFDYKLPPELIAQTPIEPRDRSRLMVVDRRTMEVVGTPTAAEETAVRDCLDFLPAFIEDETAFLFTQWTSSMEPSPYPLTSWRFDLMPAGVGEESPPR